MIWNTFESVRDRLNLYENPHFEEGSGIADRAEPMLGILGTVTGIIRTFSGMGPSAGAVDPFAATAGIGEALITTAAGLAASLLLLLPYNIIAEKIDGCEK
jgi:biopolymer transport protein ExbB